MANIEYFKSEKTLTRFEFVKRIIIFIGLILLSNFLYPLRFPHRDHSIVPLLIADLLIGGGLLTWIFTSIIVTQIQIDYDRQNYIVLYMTVFSENKRLEIPFHLLSFQFQKKPTRSQTKTWMLNIFKNKKKVFSLTTNEDGFSQETLENLAMHLKKITEKAAANTDLATGGL